jgi:hypothetical protein
MNADRRPISHLVPRPTSPLHVLVFQDLPGRWWARSLEHDLAVEGRNFDAVVDRILQLIFAHIDFDRRHGRVPLSAFPAAPRRFWEAFSRARPVQSVSRGSADSSLTYGPIEISLCDSRPAPDRRPRPVRADRRHPLEGPTLDGTPLVPRSGWDRRRRVH